MKKRRIQFDEERPVGKSCRRKREHSLKAHGGLCSDREESTEVPLERDLKVARERAVEISCKQDPKNRLERGKNHDVRKGGCW